MALRPPSVPWHAVELAHGRGDAAARSAARDGRDGRRCGRRNADWLRQWEATRPPEDARPAGDLPDDGARPAAAGPRGPLPAFRGARRRRLRRPADGQQHRGRIGAVRQRRLLDRPSGTRGRATCRSRWRWRSTTAGSSSGLHRIEVAIRPENVASLRVVEKLGFTEVGYAPRYLHIDGAWRDHRLFALTVEDVPGGLSSLAVHRRGRERRPRHRGSSDHTSHTSCLPTHRTSSARGTRSLLPLSRGHVWPDLRRPGRRLGRRSHPHGPASPRRGGETRAVDNFSDDLRVLARREAVNARESRLVVPSRLRRTPTAEATPAATDAPAPSTTAEASAETDRRSPAALVPRRAARPARRPARRPGPRHPGPASRLGPSGPPPPPGRSQAPSLVLALLLVVTLGPAVGSLTGALQPWAPAVPVASSWASWCWPGCWPAASSGPGRPSSPTPSGPRPRRLPRRRWSWPTCRASLPGDHRPRRAAGLRWSAASTTPPASRSALDRGRRPRTPVEGLWDPLPVTLPTYVTKPRAHRSVRTIDLLEPGVVSSGRNAADSALVAEAATARPRRPSSTATAPSAADRVRALPTGPVPIRKALLPTGIF